MNRMEYTQDKLRKEIADLKFEISQMELEQDKQNAATLVAEILLCLVMFISGFALGRFL